MACLEWFHGISIGRSTKPNKHKDSHRPPLLLGKRLVFERHEGGFLQLDCVVSEIT